MATRVPISDLMASLQKAGAPFGNSAAMQQATPGLQDTLTQQITQADPYGPQLKDNFMKQLSQVAEMDQKLNSVYSDPTSPLFTNNIMAREKIRSGAYNTGSSAVGNLAKRYKENEKSIQQQVKDTLDHYKQLTALAAKEEDRAERLIKEEEMIKQGKGKYVTDDNGNKVMVRTYKGSKDKLTIREKYLQSIQDKQEYDDAAAEVLSLKDGEAVGQFNKATKDYQDYLTKLIITGELKPPPGGFSASDIKQGWLDFERKYGKGKDKKSLYSTTDQSIEIF